MIDPHLAVELTTPELRLIAHALLNTAEVTRDCPELFPEFGDEERLILAASYRLAAIRKRLLRICGQRRDPIGDKQKLTAMRNRGWRDD